MIYPRMILNEKQIKGKESHLTARRKKVDDDHSFFQELMSLCEEKEEGVTEAL